MKKAPIAVKTIGAYLSWIKLTPLKKEPPFLAGQLHERPQVKELRGSFHNHVII